MAYRPFIRRSVEQAPVLTLQHPDLPRDPARQSWWGRLTVRITRAIMARYLEWYHRIECSGTEHVPRTGPLLVVANHASNLDPLALAYGIRRPLHFLAARGLFRIPPVAYVLRQWGALPVAPGGLDIAAVRTCVTILRTGGALAIFPEGTRSRDGRLQPFQSGPARMAILARAPVLPAGILGTFEALPPGALFPKPVKLRVRYGRPFELAEYYNRRLTAEDVATATARLRDAVATLLDSW
jgi:1-acyl-sn-glycerol-3-phosphate acyltransferase